MANNLVGETHHPTTMIRTNTGDTETYQQCNYQTFQMLVHSVVDQLNTDEIRMKHLQNISDNIEILSTLPNYPAYIDLLVKNFLRSLIETDTVFIIPSNAQTIRKQMIEIFHRLPITESLRQFVKDILSPMFKLLTKENEENALLLLRIIVEYMKQFRLQMNNEVREFLQFVHNVYRQKASALDQIFLKKSFTFPTMTIHEIDLTDLIGQISSSVQLKVKKIQTSITTDETTTTNNNNNTSTQSILDTYTILSRASNSVKLLAEFPVAIVLLYQLCRQSLQAEFGELVPLFLRYLTLQPSKEQKNDREFNIEIYIEFLTTQAKTLSFLAFVSKTYHEQLALNSEYLVTALLQLLEGCPPENVQLRKDIIVAARHFLSTDFRIFFIPHVKRFFDENLILSSGYTARESLKALAYNTFGDFFHHIRANLAIEDLQSVLYMYSKMIHDTSLPLTIQVMSLKFLPPIADAIRQKGSEKSRDLLIRVIEILVFKCKSLAKQCTYLTTNSNDKSTIASINEIDISTCSLAELVQNMTEISNREKELQRQQFSTIRFQSPSSPLTSTDCRTLLKALVSSLRHITWILADVKVADNLVTPPKQFPPSITLLYIKFFKYILQCLILFFDSTSLINNSTTTTTTTTRNKEEKEIMDTIASIFIVMHKQNYREIFETNLRLFYQCANKNSNLTIIMNTLLQQSPSSTILVELLLEFLLPRINEIGETNNTNNACLKLFKLVINSVVTTTTANENEKILQPYLKQIILRSIECAQLTIEPYNYFILLRALFRSIGVGNHELLNQEFLTLLHFLLQRLNEYQSCKHRQNLRELFIELCLTVPVRLSVLLPYLPLLMEPLVNALNGSSTLILQGLRTLELCVDNLQPDFLYNHILPVRNNLMASLYRLLNHLNNDIAQNTFRILGKLGGNNRRILNEPQEIPNEQEENNNEHEIYVQMFFENDFKSLNIPLRKILQTCHEQLKSNGNEQIKRQAWLIIRSILSIILSNDNDHDLVNYLLNHKSFLNQHLSQCPKIWNSHLHIHSRYAHDLILQCLHQAATCKHLIDDALPLLKSTIQHYTLVALTQQTGPLISDIYTIENTIDCSIILIDSIIACYIDIDDELNNIGRLTFDILFETLLIQLNNNTEYLTKLPLMNYLLTSLFDHCHDRMWYAKQGSCRFLYDLFLKYFSNEINWFYLNLNKILENFFHVIISLTDEISTGTLDLLFKMIKEFLNKTQSISSNENLIELLLNYLFSPINTLRTFIFDCLKQLSQLYQQSILRLIEPFKNVLIEKFTSISSYPFKNQSLIYQITYLDIYIFFRTLEPKITYLTLFDEDLFNELVILITDENDTMNKYSSYRSLTQQQFIENLLILKKLSLKTLGEYYEQIDYRDRILRLFYKILTTIQSNDLQLIAYESMEKIFNGHQNDQLRIRSVNLYLQQISFFDNEKFDLTPQIAQTLFYLAKLSPNSFDERLCEQILNLIRKLMQNIAQIFRLNFDSTNQFYKTCLILLDLLSKLPNLTKKIIDNLTILILKFDKHLMIESSSLCRKYLIDLLICHPQISLDQFLSDENRFQDLQWTRLFLDLLKHSSSTNIQTFVRTNWLDRFRQILSDHIVLIETTQNIPSIICITIRSLSILARTDQLWWSRQHELVSLLLRLWRSNTFQQHSFISSEHFDSFCSKELNNVLNLCLIYYQYQPERIRLLLELTRIYNCQEKLFYPKKFFSFIQEKIIKTYTLKWKRDTLLTFLTLKNDESYTLECKSLFFEYIILPSFIYEFETNPTQITQELFQINSNNDETILDLFLRNFLDKKYFQQINDKYRICLLRFLCLFLEYNPQLICDMNQLTGTNRRENDKIRRLMDCTYETLLTNNIDSTFKCQAHLLLCYIISKYSIVKKIIMHVFNSLLKSYIIDAKYLVRQATDLLIPAIPIRMDDGYDILAICTKKILSDDAHGNLQLIHIMTIIVRHQIIYYHVRYTLANLMIQSAQRIASQQTNSIEHKKLAIDIIEVIIKWELRKHIEQNHEQKHFTRNLIDTIFAFLIRHACQINVQTMIGLSQQCIRLFKIAKKYAWPQIDVKLITFERLIHQIESPNVNAHASIAIAIDLLAFLISTYTVIQIKYTMRTLKRSLTTCVSITNNPRLVESMQNLFSKLIIQIPIEPPASIIPTSTSTTGSTSINPVSQLQATLTAAAVVNPTNSPVMINKSEDIEQFYTIITKTIIEHMNSTATSIVNTTDSARTTIGANANNGSSSGFGSIHTLPVAFGYLKIIEKQQPKYVDKLTPHITKLLQKLIKDHTSAGVDYNPAFTEYIIECLTLLKYRIGQLTSDLRKQLMNNFLPCLIEKSYDINLVRAIIRLVYDWLKWRGDVQLVPSLKEKSQLLLKLLLCIDKSGRFHHQQQQQQQQQTNDNELTNSFLELILHVYQESNYRELCIKLEAAFILGLKSTNQQLRKQFFLILDKNLRKTLHDRLIFIFLSQNWEYLGQHYWIKQCLELFYTCVSSNIPLSIIDNHHVVLPSLTSRIKSEEFYDRYDFLIDYVKTKNPSAIENCPVKTEQNVDPSVKMEVNDESTTVNPAYSIISNALGVTAMSTLVTKKQRSTSICINESKSKHFKRTISFENIRRLSTEKSSIDLTSRDTNNQRKLTQLINDEIHFLQTLISIQSKPNDLFDSIIQFLHTNHSISIDKLVHSLFIDILPKILRIIPEKYRLILFQQILQPFFVSGTHLQQRDLYPYSSLNTILEAFSSMFKINDNLADLVPIIRPIILKYIGKTHNTWHRSILLLEQYIFNQESISTDETYIESLNSLSELYEHLNEDDYNISLWLDRQLSSNIKYLFSNALQYEQLGRFQQALDYYTQTIKLLQNESIPQSTSNRFFLIDEYSFLEQHWIKCTKELNQWENLMSYCKQQSNRDHLLYLDCTWRTANWSLMKETLGQLDAMCNGTNMNLTNSSIQTFQFLNQNPTLTQSTIISNILTIKDFQWKFALYRCYLTLCSTITNTDDPTIYQTTMNITERYIDYCSLNALKEWKHLPNYISNSHLNLLQASQRIIELQESAQILLNIQTNSNSNNNNNNTTTTNNNNNTSASIISTTTNGNTSTTTTNIRQTTNIHELKTIVKTWKSRLPLINDSLSFWNDIFTWRELQYGTISSQFDKDLNGTNNSLVNTLSNTNTGQVLLGIHAIAQSITQLGKIARKHQMPNVCMEILSRIGTVIPSVPVVDSYQKIKQIIKCYLILLPNLSGNEIPEIFDIIEQANTKYFNKDMMSEFYSLKGVAYSKLNLIEDAQKFFSCSTQLSDSNLTRTWINWGDFLLKQSSFFHDDESILICYLNACKDLIEMKARPILSKVFYLLSRDHEIENKLSMCIERYLSLVPVQHWLFWLPQIFQKLIRNESSQCMFAILNELIRLYPQAVYTQIKKSLKLNINDEQSIPVTPIIDDCLTLPKISSKQQAKNHLKRLEEILFEQHPTIVRTLDILIEQLNTINETFFEYFIRRLYQCQRQIYQDLYEKKSILSDDIKQILQHLKDLVSNQDKSSNEQIQIQFSQDFNETILNQTHINRSFILLINKWIILLERRIEQTEPHIKYLNTAKYLHLLSFNSQITNDINMPGELWHAPEANFYFRINKFFPKIERRFKHERYYVRLTIRAHNGKIIYYLLSNNYQILPFDQFNLQWSCEENTLQFFKMINNICIRKEKELLKRHMQIYLPHFCTYLPSLRLIEDNYSTINLIEIFNDRLLLAVRKYYELIDENQENTIEIYERIQKEFFSNKQLLQQWTSKQYSTATGYFSFRKIFTISISFYSTLNYLFGFHMYTNNQLNIQSSIGNINPFQLKLDENSNETISLTPNIEIFINRFGKMGPFTATILATLTAFAQSKYQLIEYLKIFYKEHFHIKHSDLSQKECVDLVENLAKQLEIKLNQFTDFDTSKNLVSQLVQNSTDIQQLSRLNPLYYPWL